MASDLAIVSESASLDPIPAPLDKFKVFPKLPAELRVKIWKMCSPPRIIEVRWVGDKRKNQHRFVADFPVILGVCQESRAEGKKIYKLSFENKDTIDKAKIWFNFEMDTLYISRCAAYRQRNNFMLRGPTGDLAKVEKLAMDSSHFTDMFDASRTPKPTLFQLKTIKHLIVLISPNFKINRCPRPCVHDWSCIFDLDEFRNLNQNDQTRLSSEKTFFQTETFALEVELSAAREGRNNRFSQAGWTTAWSMPNISLMALCERAIPRERRFLELSTLEK